MTPHAFPALGMEEFDWPSLVHHGPCPTCQAPCVLPEATWVTCAGCGMALWVASAALQRHAPCREEEPP